MASSSGNSSGSTQIQQISGDEKQQQQKQQQQQSLIDLRKRKRMQSNRESARRSRQRKQRHLDELMAQVSEIRKDNGCLLNGITATTQQFLAVESENSVLKAQMVELRHRLDALDGIVRNMSAAAAGGSSGGGHHLFPSTAAAAGGVTGLGTGFFEDFPATVAATVADGFANPLMNFPCYNQPIMASANAAFQY